VLCCVPQHIVISTHIWAVLTGVLGPAGLGIIKDFVFFLPRTSLFILYFCFIFPCLFCAVRISAVIAWKDSSQKWAIMCRTGHKTLLTHWSTFLKLFQVELGPKSKLWEWLCSTYLRPDAIPVTCQSTEIEKMIKHRHKLEHNIEYDNNWRHWSLYDCDKHTYQ